MPGASRMVFLGLPGVHVARGSHIAHFFHGEEERLTVLVPFLRAGLEAGDLCLLVAERRGASVLMSRLEELGVDLEPASASRQWIVSDGASEAEGMASVFGSVVAQARSAGRDVIRIGGDMTWALEKMPTGERLLQWEAYYDQYVGSSANFVAVCQCDHSRFGGSAIMHALQTHPLSIIGGVVQENPFHRDPAEVLRELSRGAVSRGPQ